jgi:hypothetical protein
MKYIAFDTEFLNTKNERLTPVCAVLKNKTETFKFWHDQMGDFKKIFDKYVLDGYYVLTFSSVAEYRFLLSIGYSREQLKKVRMVDIYILWRIVLFGLREYNWGKYIISKGGKKQTLYTRPPVAGELQDGEWYIDSDGNEYKAEDIKTRKYNPSLVHACLRLLDIDIDSDHKTEMRDIILNGEYNEYKNEVLDYCESDTIYLGPLLQKLYNIIQHYDTSFNEKDALSYSRWMLDASVIESIGIPIDVEKLKNFASNWPILSIDIPTKCNKVFEFFVWDKRQKKYVRNYERFKVFVESTGIKWPRTEKGKYKQDKDTLQGMQNSFLEIRTLNNTKNALREIGYFSPNRVDRILNNIDAEGRLRCSLMPYSSVTGRNQPKPTEGYVFLMSRWLRNMVKGVIIGGDYSAQEIFLQAKISGDKNFMKCYTSSDPYTWFAKASGVIPKEVERRKGLFYIGDTLLDKTLQSTYTQSRTIFKAILLGVGYGMGEDSLALNLSAALIDTLSEEERKRLFSGDKALRRKMKIGGKGDCSVPPTQRASFYLNLYNKTFSTYVRWKKNIYDKYKNDGVLKLSDGWRRIGKDGNATSVMNFPIQGEGQVMLREATSLCLDRGLKVITTLHDAIYIESTEENKLKDTEILRECMESAGKGIRISIHEQLIDWVNFKSDWSDEKGFEEFRNFGKYFLNRKKETLGELLSKS